LKTGLFIHQGTGGSMEHKGSIITEVLGNGKFLAVEMDKLKPDRSELFAETKEVTVGGKKYYWSNGIATEYDLTLPINQTNQQAIKLTPEIKALVKGEAPKLKQPSGVSPFVPTEPKPVLTSVGVK
jgi:hypothetical protein